MTSPKAKAEESPAPFLVTTTKDKDGNYGSEMIDITQLSDALLFQYVADGNERAAAELLARIAAFEEESGMAPEEAEAAPEPEPEEEST